jgi:L-fucose mutarotase
MLKGIPTIVSPELLKILMEMGHGDELVIADGNFPAASHAQRLVRLDGHGVPEVLDAVLSLIPLDQYVDKPAAVMGVVPGDPVIPVIWKQFDMLTEKHEGKPIKIEELGRFAFYERAKQAYAIVATSERAQYANIIVKKGVL